MKIGIVTLTGQFNYGNRLQNYALSEVLSQMGHDVETIWNSTVERKKSKTKTIVKDILRPMVKGYDYSKSQSIRRKNFLRFSKENIKLSDYEISDNKENIELKDMYDRFVVGSDQVWNYSYPTFTKTYFLMFADSDKTISYAASFGVSKVSKESIPLYKAGLKHIKYISVREEAGAKLVKEIANKKAQVTLDPTLLLSKDEWEKKEKKPRKMTDKKYILTYFLGNISDDRKAEIEKIANKNDMEIINLNDIKQYNYYSSGPSEFLYLFHHASLILTDSFHACVFSIIYANPFFVFEREDKSGPSMESRINNILGMLDLNDRRIKTLKGNKKIFEAKYDNCEEILKKEKKKSIDFLTKALRGE